MLLEARFLESLMLWSRSDSTVPGKPLDLMMLARVVHVLRVICASPLIC